MNKVFEQNGIWAVGKDGDGLVLMGGSSIPYETYKELKDKPHEAEKHFHRVKGKLIAKPDKKVT